METISAAVGSSNENQKLYENYKSDRKIDHVTSTQTTVIRIYFVLNLFPFERSSGFCDDHKCNYMATAAHSKYLNFDNLDLLFYGKVVSNGMCGIYEIMLKIQHSSLIRGTNYNVIDAERPSQCASNVLIEGYYNKLLQ